MGMNDRHIDNSDYNDFLNQLISEDCLEGAALGITKQVIDKGMESLTERQNSVFNKHVLGAFTKDCECGDNIQWSEMYEAVTDHGLCSYCVYTKEKIMSKDN